MTLRRKPMFLAAVLTILLACVLCLIFFRPQTRAVLEHIGIIEQKTVALPIIMYHHFDKNPEKWGEATMPPDEFEEHMAAVRAAGYTSITYRELYEYVKGLGELPEKPIIITLDDGYYSNYEYAYPLLKQYGMKGVISMIGWSVGEVDYKDKSLKIIPHFTWEEAREMSNSGYVEIASHTYDLHEDGRMQSPRNGCEQLPGESDGEYYDALYEDFKKMYDLIAENVHKPLVLTYPYGIYTDISERAAEDAGYKITVSTDSGINYITRTHDLKTLKRHNIPAGMAAAELLALLEDR